MKMARLRGHADEPSTSAGGRHWLGGTGAVRRRQFPSDFKLAMVGSWMMLAFILLFFVSSVIGDRFGYYLIPIQAMIFARIPYLNLGKNRQIHVVSPYVLLTLVFVVWTSTSWHFSYCYTPYQFGFG